MKNILRKISLLLVFIFAFTIVGCNKTASNTNSNTKNDTKVADKTQGVYPYSYTSKYGTILKLDKEPQRIVSLSPTYTEVIYALDKGDKLVGRTDFCDYPAKVSTVTSVGSISNPSLEKILSLKPDLVIVSMMKDDVLKKLTDAGLNVMQLAAGESIEGSFKNMTDIATALNAKEKVEEINKSINDKINNVSQKVKDNKNKVKVYYVAGFGKDGEFTAGDKTFINDLIEKAGAQNVAKDAVMWKYTTEKLMEKNPNLVFMGKMSQAKQTFETTDPYKKLNAVKNKRVFEVDDNLINREGPRMGEAIEMIAKLFYPELFK